MRGFAVFAPSILVCLFFCQGIVAQEPLPLGDGGQSIVPIALNSGSSVNLSEQSTAVFAETVSVPGVSWLRLKFDRAELGESAPGRPRTYLRITSLLDGAVQILDETALAQWKNTSAFFNGDRLLVEIVADGSAEASYLAASQAWAGAPVPPSSIDETICGPLDDRALSSDPRIGRAFNGRFCTAFIVDDAQKCLISAGHCLPLEVISFNVPLSTAGGALVHPSPDHQYVVDTSSIQSSNSFGDDWSYFGVFPNSNTGLTPYEAQGNVAFTLQDPQSPMMETIRITGYGSTAAPVSPTWYAVQKTHTGDYTNKIGDVLYYTADTTGGNSGGPVILEGSDTAIGIHTNGGCFNGGGENSGTAINASGLTTAMANPLGVCRGASELTFSYLNPLPPVIDPLFHQIVVMIDAMPGSSLDSSSPMLFTSIDGGVSFTPKAMIPLGGNRYLAEFPHLACSEDVRYYMRAATMSGTMVYDHTNAPESSHLATVARRFLDYSIRFDFEEQAGWTTEASVDTVSGFFERGVPNGGGFNNQPAHDGDGSGYCFVTGNDPLSSDVSGSAGNDGVVTLKSPVISVFPFPGLNAGFVHYKRWVGWSQSSFLSSNDSLAIFVRIAGSPDRFLLEEIDTTHPDVNDGWKEVMIDLTGIIGTSLGFVLEFEATDSGDPSELEVAIDDVRYSRSSFYGLCVPPCPTNVFDGNPGTFMVDGDDTSWAVRNWFTSDRGDVDEDERTTILDIVNILRTQGACPFLANP